MSEHWWVGKKTCCTCGALLTGSECLSCEHKACVNCPTATPSEIEQLRLDVASLQQQLTEAERTIERLRSAVSSLTQDWMEPRREGYVLWSDWKKAHDAFCAARAALSAEAQEEEKL